MLEGKEDHSAFKTGCVQCVGSLLDKNLGSWVEKKTSAPVPFSCFLCLIVSSQASGHLNRVGSVKCLL